MADALVLIALLIAIGAVAFCVWVFWSAARVIPQPYRMRWPWLVWLLLLPVPIWILSQVLPLITLVPLARSYRRFFRENQINGGGDCGLTLAIAYWLLSLLALLYLVRPLGLMPPPTSPMYRTFIMDIISVNDIGRACGWMLLLFLSVRFWFLRRAVLQYRPADSTADMRDTLEKNLTVQERRRKKVSLGLLTLMVLLLATDQYWVYAWQVVPISHGTTCLTGPIEKDGSVNYLAALDQMEGRGVTPENNALPPLIQAAGPKCFNTKYGGGRWVMRKLGMPPFTRNSKSLITFTRWIKKHPLPLPQPGKVQPKGVRESRMEDRIMEHPWTARQFPSFAQWIKANARVLRLFSEAMRKSRYYIPLRSQDGSVLGIFRPDQSMIASLQNLACADTMFLLGNGNTVAAIHEARDVYRLARLMTQSPGTISGLQAIATATSALQLDRALANSGRLSDLQLRGLLTQVNRSFKRSALPAMLNDARYVALDSLMRRRRDGLTAEFGASTFRTLQQYFLPIDYAKLLRSTNRLFNQEVAAAAVTDFRKRLALLQHADQQFRAYSGYERMGITGSIAAMIPVVRGGSFSGLVLRSLFEPLDIVVSVCGPNGAQLGVFCEEARTRSRLTKLSIALALYKRRHHQYPASLSQLVPHYLPAIANDAFTGQPVHYFTVHSGHGFLLSCNQPLIELTPSAFSFGGRNASMPQRKFQVKAGDWRPRAAAK